jgi:hypothetical protein
MAQFPADPKRDAAAKLLAESGHSWARVTLREARGAFKAGSKFFGIPSSRDDGTAYYTNLKVCTCPDYQQRGAICKHMRAVALYSDTLRALRPQRSGSAQEADPTPAPRLRYEDLFSVCAAGCGELVEKAGRRCYACASDEARRLEMAAKRNVFGQVIPPFALNPLAE